jgi:DNA-binding NtrC family response regulator
MIAAAAEGLLPPVGGLSAMTIGRPGEDLRPMRCRTPQEAATFRNACTATLSRPFAPKTAKSRGLTGSAGKLPKASAMSRRGRASEDGPQIIGRSPAIKRLLRQIALVAPTEATVLVLGERGTGKELVADALQRDSRRRDKPYIKVNCAALPTELLASELFGHERGAFTGALERRRGLLAAADGGTLFLDEIGDLPLPAQAMLLRFLEQREIRPLGSTETFRVDVRVIAATNRDLAAAIGGAFRADLCDRLSEIVLEVPSLRERDGDIALLIRHFVERHTRRHRRAIRGLGPDALALAERYAWPGNVRELEQAVSRMVIFAAVPWIGHVDLRVGLRVFSERTADGSPSAGLSLRQQQIEAIARHHGSVGRANVVSRLGVSGETARRDLVALVRIGILQRHGRHRSCRYTLAPADSIPGIDV